MNRGERGPDLYYPKNEHSHERAPDFYYPPKGNEIANPERQKPTRLEQEQKIKKSKKVKKFIMSCLIAAGVIGGIIGISARANSANIDAFAYNQKANIQQSAILQENNIGPEDIKYGKDNMQFSIDGVHYKLKVDTIELDNEGPSNMSGGIYEGTATFEDEDKIITKTFRADDKKEGGHSLNSGVSIDQAVSELGYTPKENVIE